MICKFYLNKIAWYSDYFITLLRKSVSYEETDIFYTPYSLLLLSAIFFANSIFISKF